MKIAHLNTRDSGGGAAIAALRLHRALLARQCESWFIAHQRDRSDNYILKTHSDFFALLRQRIDKSVFDFCAPRPATMVSAGLLPNYNALKLLRQLDVDLVNLHWINNGMLSLGDLPRFKLPLVWTLHDMWAFTGGCHYAAACTRYTDVCESCPQTQAHQRFDLIKSNFSRRLTGWRDLPLHVVTPSHWLAECARRSRIFQDKPVTVIPNPIDTTLFRPHDKQLARGLFGLPADAQLILFGAMNATSAVRKGFDLLRDALHALPADQRSSIELVVFGADGPGPVDEPFEFKVHYVGTLFDELSLALLYSATDLMVIPSREDNLPNTGVEAMACGTPCVSFNIGGLPDIIDHQNNGFLASPFNTDEFAEGMSWCLGDTQRTRRLATSARAKAIATFDSAVIARRYCDLYTTVLGR